ncbi:hypothetical protein CF160_11295 [Enterococcus pseudoavium]|nr:hypothetical protein CF160_11295 [Enterococcus pseudoavium]
MIILSSKVREVVVIDQRKDKDWISQVDPYLWSPIYKELTKLVGIEATLKIYQEYRGSQLTFPMRLVDHRNLPQILESEYNGHNLRQIARYYGYSERHLRRILNDMKKLDDSDSTLLEAEIPYVKDLDNREKEK